LATSGPENSSEKGMFSVLVGRWRATMSAVVEGQFMQQEAS